MQADNISCDPEFRKKNSFLIFLALLKHILCWMKNENISDVKKKCSQTLKQEAAHVHTVLYLPPLSSVCHQPEEDVFV